MGSSITGIALKALGGLLVALLVLSVVGTIVGLVVGFVTTIVLLAVTTVAFVLFLGFSLWLASTLLGNGGGSTSRGADPTGRSSDRSDDASETASRSWRDRLPGGGRDAADDERDEAERLRERYVAGEIDEAEFERRLALLLETSDLTESATDRSTGTANRDESFRDRLFE